MKRKKCNLSLKLVRRCPELFERVQPILQESWWHRTEHAWMVWRSGWRRRRMDVAKRLWLCHFTSWLCGFQSSELCTPEAIARALTSKRTHVVTGSMWQTLDLHPNLACTQKMFDAVGGCGFPSFSYIFDSFYIWCNRWQNNGTITLVEIVHWACLHVIWGHGAFKAFEQILYIDT